MLQTICTSKLFLNFAGKCSVPTNVQEIHYSDFLAAMVLFWVLIFACSFLWFSDCLLPLLRCHTFILLNLRSARVFPSTIIFCRLAKTHACAWILRVICRQKVVDAESQAKSSWSLLQMFVSCQSTFKKFDVDSQVLRTSSMSRGRFVFQLQPCCVTEKSNRNKLQGKRVRTFNGPRFRLHHGL